MDKSRGFHGEDLVNLRQSFIEKPPIPTDKPKVDYFDTQLTEFMLEVRSSGKCTYYLRYRDRSSREGY